MELRPYQKRAVAEILNRASPELRLVVVLPGGGGKSVIISEATRAYVIEKKRVMIVTPRKEILEQIDTHLREFGVESVSILSAKLGRTLIDPYAQVHIVSKETAVRRLPIPNIDVVFVDECHHVVADGYQRLLQMYPNATHVGFTATPLRADGRGLDEWYDDMLVAALPSELIEQGYLAAPRIFTTLDEYLPDLRHIPVRYGEYSTKHLANEVMRQGLAGAVVQNYLQHGNGKPFVGFSVTVAHSLQFVTEFLAAGIPVAHVDGDTDNATREKILHELRTGKLMGVFNCMLLCEGWDFPGCEVVIMARPTKSLALFLQQASRGMRPLPEKRPIILDHARNSTLLGLPHANRHFTLSGIPAVPTTIGPTKTCRHCRAVVERELELCPNCGAPFGRDIVLPVEAGGALEELTKKKIFEFRARLEATATARGWHNNWVEAVLERWLSTNGLQ